MKTNTEMATGPDLCQQYKFSCINNELLLLLSLLSVTVHSLLPVHNSLPSDIRTSTSTRLRNIRNPTSFNCLSPACRACDYVYTDYVRHSRSSSCHLLRSINCQTYITLLSLTQLTHFLYLCVLIERYRNS